MLEKGLTASALKVRIRLSYRRKDVRQSHLTQWDWSIEGAKGCLSMIKGIKKTINQKPKNFIEKYYKYLSKFTIIEYLTQSKLCALDCDHPMYPNEFYTIIAEQLNQRIENDAEKAKKSEEAKKVRDQYYREEAKKAAVQLKPGLRIDSLKKVVVIEVNSRWDELSPENQLSVVRLINSLAAHSNPKLDFNSIDDVKVIRDEKQ